MQAAIPIAAAVAAAAVGAGAAAMLAPKPQVPPKPINPDRSDAAALANSNEFRRRQGAAANMLTGPSGAEAPSPGTKALLGQ